MERKIDRRQALGAFGAVSLGGLLAACGDDGAGSASVTTSGATSTVQAKSTTSKATAALFDESASCELTTELTEGPFYFDVDSIRRDISGGREGTRLRLALRVRDAESCKPIENAIVDVWHCDALGIYSGFESASQGAGGGGPGGGSGGGSGPTDEKTYLRGAQATNGDGIVEFVTVYPGWYRGRTVHIHSKVHHAAKPYAEDGGRDVYNDADGIYDRSLELTLSQEGDDVRRHDLRRAQKLAFSPRRRAARTP